MSMLAGDVWILNSYVIHRGGENPRDAPAGSTSIIAFAAIATRRADYETIVPIIPPPWAEAPAQQPSPLSPCTLREPAVRIGDSRYRESHNFLLCFACNLVPSCAFFVLSSPKAWSNKCVQIGGFK